LAQRRRTARKEKDRIRVDEVLKESGIVARREDHGAHRGRALQEGGGGAPAQPRPEAEEDVRPAARKPSHGVVFFRRGGNVRLAPEQLRKLSRLAGLKAEQEEHGTISFTE